MQIEQRRQDDTTAYKWSTIVLPTKVRCILNVLFRTVHIHILYSMQFYPIAFHPNLRSSTEPIPYGFESINLSL